MERAAAVMGSAPGGPGEQEELSLAFTLCARLCHDLAGTLGALAGALTMAVEGGESEALTLASDCAQELSARLCLLRSTWSAECDTPDITALLPGLPGIERLRIDLSGLSPVLADAPRRLSTNLLLMAAQSLPRGGSICLAGDDDGLSLEIAGPRAGWSPALGDCLAGRAGIREASASHREVGIAVTCLLAQALGLRIVVESPTVLFVHPAH